MNVLNNKITQLIFVFLAYFYAASTLSASSTVGNLLAFDDDTHQQYHWSVNNSSIHQTANIYSSGNAYEYKGTYALLKDSIDNERWINYIADMDIRSTDNDFIGVMFRYIDENNYYRFNWNAQSSKRQLIKVKDGAASLLAEDLVAYELDKTYALKIDADGASIEVYIDNINVLSANDNSFSHGAMALYCSGNTGCHYENIAVKDVTTDALLSTPKNMNALQVIDEGITSGPSNWLSKSENPWAIDSSRSYSGDYSLRSGGTNQNEKSTLSTIVNTNGDAISFFISVSSQSCCDYLIFYIDDIEMGRWSGEVDFTYVEFALEAGKHRFEWRYETDGNVSEGVNAAWLDNIHLPGDADSDNDGIADALEYTYFDHLNSDLSFDHDSDGLTTEQELLIGTNPQAIDSDHDGLPDNWEVHHETDPIAITYITANAGEDFITFGTLNTQLIGSGLARTAASIVSFQWTQISGEAINIIQANQAKANFFAPNVSTEKVILFLLTVTDSSGHKATNTVAVTVKPFSEYNFAPTLVGSQEVLVAGNEQVSITIAATDKDNDPLTYTWVQTSGESVTVASTNTNTLAFTAPNETSNKVYSFKLSVTDNNHTVERTVVVAVKAPEIIAGTYYYHNDHLGTPQMMTDTSATVVWQANYTPFGEADIIVEAVTNNIRFPGQYYDQESDLHYNYFRDYDPELGRYIQSDPIGLAGGINTYGYVGGNPINLTDPFGLVAKGNHKLDLAQVEQIKQRLKDSTLDKKTRNELKQKLKRHEKATGERHSRGSQSKKSKVPGFVPFILWNLHQKQCRMGLVSGNIGCSPENIPKICA